MAEQMVQIVGVTLNGNPFVVDEKVAVSSKGQVVVLEDKPIDGRFK